MVVEIGHQVDDHLEGEVGLAIDHVFDAAHRLDAGLQRGLELVVGDRLLAAFIDGGLDHFAHDGLAELLLQERDRRLAGAEALEIDAGLHLFQARIDPALQLAGQNGHRELLVQVLGKGLADLHVDTSLFFIVLGTPGAGT